MSDSVDRVFVHALNTVKRIPRTGSARPPPSDRLKLYGLYKQSTEGDVEGLSQRPVGDDPEVVTERDKWDAWHAHHGLSRTEAKRRYISTLIETMHRYATTTPEARELVSELEFVWDQIKSNTASSVASSPDQLPEGQSQQMPNHSYASFSGPSAKGSKRTAEGGASGLRVLRPVSDGDEEEHDDDEEHIREDGDSLHGEGDPTPEMKNLDARNRKWRKRIEQAVVKMTAEVAALREQIEAKKRGEGRQHNGLWRWIVWLVWSAIRHALLDLAVLGILVVWARRKRDQRVAMGLGLLIQYVTEQAGRLLRPLRMSPQQR